MAVIVTRAGKGSPLTNAEVDQNFINLNAGHFETIPVVINASAPTPPPVPIDAMTILQVVGAAGQSARIELDGFGGGGAFVGRRANGTPAAPSAVKSGDSLTTLNAIGYATTGYTPGQGSIRITAAEDWTDAARGTAMYFSTTPNGGTVAVDRWAIGYNGWLVPMADNIYDIGLTNQRVRTLYAGNVDVAGPITVAGSGSFSPAVQATAYATRGANFDGWRVNGTPAAPLPVKAFDQLAAFTGKGRSPTLWSSSQAAISMSASADWSDTSMPADINMQTTPVGSNVLQNRWQFSSTGHFFPFGDAAYDVGGLTNRVRNIYAAAAQIQAYGAFAPFFGFSANGTSAAPTASKAGDPLGVYQGIGRGATGWGAGGAAFVTRTLENWTDTAQGAGAYIATTSFGTTALLARWEFSAPGHFIPFADLTYDIGGGLNRVRNIYADTAVLASGLTTTGGLSASNIGLSGPNAAIGIGPRDGSGTTFQWYNPTGDYIGLHNGTAEVFTIDAAGHIQAGAANFGGLITTANSAGSIATAVGASTLMVMAAPGVDNAAYMTFHRPGTFAAFFGIDTDNQLKYGGWSNGSVSYTIWHSGNLDAEPRGKYYSLINATSTDYGLTLADQGRLIFPSHATAGTPQTITIPLNSAQPFPVGARIDLVAWGTGQVSVVPTAGVVLASAGNRRKLKEQYSGATLTKMGFPDIWLLVGDLTL